MKKFYVILFTSVLFSNANSQNVGIGTTTPHPTAKLHVDVGTSNTDGFLVTGIYSGLTTNTIPNLGPGSRLMYYPGKAAFRAGTINGTQWDDINTGLFSFASGVNNYAIGTASVAMGSNTYASGDTATALGAFTIASGKYTTAMGYGSAARAIASVATGSVTNANGGYSFTGGFNTTANGVASVALGQSTTANGMSSFSTGLSTRASGENSFAMGVQTVSRAYNSLAIGLFNDSAITSCLNCFDDDNPLLYIGNGTSNISRHNAMVVYQNGNMIVKNRTAVTSDPASFTIPVSGAGTRMMWLPEKGAFRVGTVFNNRWDAANIGLYSFAAGRANLASGLSSTALGDSSVASGSYSLSAGRFDTASGTYATAIGQKTKASGAGSTSMGFQTHAKASFSVAIGRWNDETASESELWASADPLLILGNGTSNTDRSNAMVVYKNGNTEINGSVQVGSGTKFSKMQGGSVLIGSSATVLKSVTFTFPISFATVPRIVCTVVNDDPAQPNVNDTWVVSIRNISPTGCTVNVVRVDAAAGWATQAKLSWFAFTN